MKKRYWALLLIGGYTLVSIIDHRIADYLHGVVVAEGAGYGTVMKKEDIDWDGEVLQISPCAFQRKWYFYVYQTCFAVRTDTGSASFRMRGPAPFISPLGLMIKPGSNDGFYFDGAGGGTVMVHISDFGKIEEFLK